VGVAVAIGPARPTERAGAARGRWSRAARGRC
jgi:hypothetical protein